MIRCVTVFRPGVEHGGHGTCEGPPAEDLARHGSPPKVRDRDLLRPGLAGAMTCQEFVI
ncbi:hypothetical protein ACWEPC_25500 [Nonomuraea sp. NPDC004297]